MIEGHFRKYYQAVCVEPLLRQKWLQSVSPTSLTIVACLCGVAASPCIAFGWIVPALTLLILSGYLDTLDGSLARLQNRTSPFGTVSDIISDRLVEFTTLLGLYYVDPESRASLTLFMLGSILLCVTSFLVVGIFTDNESEKSFHYSPGLMERAEAFIFFSLMIILPSFFTLFALLFCLLVLTTTAIRLWEFKKHQEAVAKLACPEKSMFLDPAASATKVAGSQRRGCGDTEKLQ